MAISFAKEYYIGKYHCTIDLLFDWFGISCMTMGRGKLTYTFSANANVLSISAA